MAAGTDRRGACARATDVRVTTVHRGQQQPGWCCWPAAWLDDCGTLYATFQEITRGENPTWEPIPLEFWEAMGLPHTYYTTLSNGAKELTPHCVVLKSTDSGDTWSMHADRVQALTVTYGWVSLSDGVLLRIPSNDYLAWHPGEKQKTWVEVSSDEGKTWKHRCDLIEGYSLDTGMYRLLTLQDGTLAGVSKYHASFGPQGEKTGRNVRQPYVRLRLSVGLWHSSDQGHSWTGPIPVLPGIQGWEPALVELPSGDLLITNSTVQGGEQVRQYVRRTTTGFVPGPVMDIVSGTVPESIVCTRSGLLVGATRNTGYQCSNDEGATWYPLADIPDAGYQPYIIELPDGRLFCIYHVGGGDEQFGLHDLYIGAATFRVDDRLPKPTKLTIRRQTSAAGDRYINSYVATLTGDGEHLAGKTVHFGYKRRYHDDTGNGIQSTAVTDAWGRARLCITEFDGETNIHQSYTVKAWFTPDAGETTLAPCESDEYFAYAITSSKRDLGWEE